MSRHQLQAHRHQRTEGAPPVRARAFFDHALPLAFAADESARPRARYAFDLAGAGGGAWTIDCAARAVVEKLEPADVVVRMPVASFEAMLRGALDVRAALRDGVVAVDGDAAALAGLSDVLSRALPRAPVLEKILRRDG